MNDFYLAVCTNPKTCEQRVFCGLVRDDAHVMKEAFLKSVSDPSDWSTFIVRCVEE